MYGEVRPIPTPGKVTEENLKHQNQVDMSESDAPKSEEPTSFTWVKEMTISSEEVKGRDRFSKNLSKLTSSD